MTAPKQDKGPLGHAFVPCTNPEHAVEHCEFVMFPGIYDSPRCNQPASAHKAEESTPMNQIVDTVTLSYRQCFVGTCGKPDANAPDEGTWPTCSKYPPACVDHLYLVPPSQRKMAPEPADKAGASFESVLESLLNALPGSLADDGEIVALENKLRAALRAAEAAARREEREEIIKAIETGLRLNLPLFVVAGRVRARGGSGE